MKIVSLIEDHPYVAAGTVFGVGIVLVFALSSGGGAVQTSDGGNSQAAYDAAIAANNATNASLVQGQLAAQVAAKQSDNALYAQQSSDAAAIAIAKRQFDSQDTASQYAAQTAARGYDSQDLETTLKYAYQTSVDNNAAGVALAQSNNDAAVSLATIAYQTGVDNNATAVAMRGYDSADLAVTTQAHSVDLQTAAEQAIKLAQNQTAAQKNQLDAATAQAQIASGLQQAMDKSAKDFALQQQTLQNAKDIAAAKAQSDKEIAAINANASVVNNFLNQYGGFTSETLSYVGPDGQQHIVGTSGDSFPHFQ